MAYTKEQKQTYFKELRARWQEAKKLLDDKKIKEIDAIIATHGLNVSQTGFLFVSIQMRRQGLDGLPYLDAKTYRGWLENGFKVRKGEKSTLDGVTWISASKKDDEQDDGFVFPKGYHLFHRSQVEAA